MNYQHEVSRIKASKNTKNRQHFYRFSTRRAIDGLWLEFGVYKGTSIQYLSRLCPEVIHGFDSFEGLPEDWHKGPKTTYDKDFFKMGGIPSSLVKNPKIQLHKGWFCDTLPVFKTKHEGQCAVIHVDCDLYSSTKTIFDELQDRIVSGTIIMFDELHSYPNYRDNEMKCLLEQDWNYDYLAYASKCQASIRIKD